MKGNINSVIKGLPESIGGANFDVSMVKTLLFGCGFKVLGWEFQLYDLKCKMIISHDDECFEVFSFEVAGNNKSALELVALRFKG